MYLTPKKWQKYWYFPDYDDDSKLIHLSGLIFHVIYLDNGLFSLNLQVETIPKFKQYELDQGLPISLIEELIKTRRHEAKRFITKHIERKLKYGNDYIFPISERLT